MVTRAIHRVAVLLLALAIIAPSLALAAEPVWVNGYVKPSSGTYVAPHFRSAPDGNIYNNWSMRGNVNPFTGAAATRVTPPPNYGGSGGYASHGGAARTTVIPELNYVGNGGYASYGIGHGLSVPVGPQQAAAVESDGDRQLRAKKLYATVTMDPLGTALAAKLEHAKRIGFQTQPKMLVRDGNAILLGEVTTEHDRVIAELFLRLEPKVSEVENLLTVARTAATAPATAEEESNARETP
ncbi:MAG: hypothetical protein ACLP9L_26745 [Thermoguttaceae bacterium]